MPGRDAEHGGDYRFVVGGCKGGYLAGYSRDMMGSMMLRNSPTRIIVMAIPAILAAGCHRANPRGMLEQGPDEFPILWEQQGTYSNITQAFRVVVRDRATLARLPIAEVPVDFDRQMVLVAALGPAPTDQVGIRITRVWREKNRIRVQVQTLHPGEAKHAGLKRTSPYHIVVVPRSDLNVVGFSSTVPSKAFEAPGVPGEPNQPRPSRKRR